jgi:hypothetical protein
MADLDRLNRNVMANFQALMATAYNFKGAQEDLPEDPGPEVVGSTAMFMAFVAQALTSDPARPFHIDKEAAKAQLDLLREGAEKALDYIEALKRKGAL